MKNNKGFTLLELMICILIICIILIIPILKVDILANQRETNELKEFIKDINYARNKTIVESTRHSILIRVDSNSYTIYKHVHPIKKAVKRREFNQGINLKSTNIKDKEVTFNLSGAPDNSGTIKLETRKGIAIEITITPATGKVNVYYNQ